MGALYRSVATVGLKGIESLSGNRMLPESSSFLPPPIWLDSNQNPGEKVGAGGMAFYSDVDGKLGGAYTEMCEDDHTMFVQTACNRLSFGSTLALRHSGLDSTIVYL